MANRSRVEMDAIRCALIERVRSDSQQGGKFSSARTISQQYGISYQTAHRVLRELVEQGMLQRRWGSGTYLPGRAPNYMGVRLHLPESALRPDSVVRATAERVTTRLTRIGIRSRLYFGQAVPGSENLLSGWYPVIWEKREAYAQCVELGIPGTLLWEHPDPGVASLLLDSIAVNDMSGGAGAAQVLARRFPNVPYFTVVGSKSEDSRNTRRIEGFKGVHPCQVFLGGDWTVEAGLRAAPQVVAEAPVAVFCVNDRLAEGLILHYRALGLTPPVLIGFDGSRVAESLAISTMAVPWAELVDLVVRSVRRRFKNPNASARHSLLNPFPVLRGELAWPALTRP